MDSGIGMGIGFRGDAEVVSTVQVLSADLNVGANEWITGLERLRLEESNMHHNRPSSDLPPSSNRPLNPLPVRPAAPLATQPVPQPPAPSQRYSIWATYGSRENAINTTINSSSSDGTIPVTGHSVTMTPASSYRSRASSETSANTIASLRQPQPQRRFASQPTPAFPEGVSTRIGEQQNTSIYNATPSARETSNQVPFCLQPRNQGFLPMHAIRNSRAAPSMPFQTPNTVVGSTVPSARFSDRYHGMHTETNASAEHLAPEQNASLWITNLPPDITHRELLGQIRNIGRVWCCFINPPDGMKHNTAAAKIVFFRPHGAQRLLQHSLTHGLQVRGYRAKVTQNRIKTAENVPRSGNDSRVLIITGESSFVNEETLNKYFGQRFVFQVDEINPLITRGGRAVIEYRFGSYRCQSQMGKISLEKDRPVGFEKAEFGEDPCEVGDNFSAYGIAVQRIQGIGI